MSKFQLKKTGVAIAALALMLTTTSYAQKWYDMTLEDNVNIEAVKAEAEKYFDKVGRGHHTGYKGYQRWLYNASRRVDENGNLYSDEDIVNRRQQFLGVTSEKSAGKSKKRTALVGGAWTPVGPFSYTRTSSWSPGQGRVVAFAVEPVSQQLIFATSPTGGVWRSTDAGASWIPLGDNLPNMNIWAVGIDPNNTNHILHLNSGSELWESYDQGDNWVEIYDFGGGTSKPRMIVWNPSNSNEYFVTSTPGVFRTTNNGANFTEVITVSCEDIAYKPGDLNTMYACGDRFYKSTNGGANWTEITNGFLDVERMKLAVTPANSNYVYVVQKEGSGYGRTYRSTNSGTSFSVQSDINSGAPNYIGSQGSRDMAIMVSSIDPDEVHIAGLNNYRSTNGGVTYTSIANWNQPTDPSYIHADVEVFRNVNGTLYAGTDGGIYRSPEGGNNYTDLTQGGLAISQFYRIGGTSPYPGTGSGLDNHQVSGGTQDNGTLMSGGVSYDWICWLGADGMETFIDYSNDQKVYGTSQNGTFYRSTNGGNTYNGVSEPESDGNWVTPFEIDPIVPETVYGAWVDVWKNTSSATGSWTNLSNGAFGSNYIDELAIAPSNNNYIYAADNSNLWVTTNGQSGSPTWVNRNSFSGNVNYIAIDPNDPQHVVLACSGTRVNESFNAGQTWTDISGNLPSIGVECAVIDDTPENGIYVGMSSGVYYINDNETQWDDFGTGLPNISIRELEIHYESSMIRVATYGRGIWETGLVGSTLNPTISEGTANVCEGDTIVLTADAGPGAVPPITYQWYMDGNALAGETNSTLNATVSGSYTCAVTDASMAGNTPALIPSFAATPVAPTVNAAQICGPGTVNLTANGSGSGTIRWYDDAATTNEVHVGSSFNPNITGSQTYYVVEEGDVPTFFSAKPDNGGGGGYNMGFYLEMDVVAPFILKTAKVYAEGAGNRLFRLLDNVGGIIDSVTLFVPDGESRITLNWNVPVGAGLEIGAETGSNLYRNNAGVTYPYTIPGLASITGSSAGATYYYYLYDWEVQADMPACVSTTSESQAVVLQVPADPNSNDETICGPGIVTLNATSPDPGTIRWFDQGVGGSVQATGGTYQPNVASSTTFYVEVQGEPQDTVNGGLTDNTGGGGFHNGDFGLEFDAMSDFILVSAKVYANGAGTRTIEVRDSTGASVSTHPINMVDGEQRITLNIPFSQGNNHVIGIQSVADMFRNNAGVSYPYTIPGLVSITNGHRFSDGGSLADYYYYLYDWEVADPNSTCLSNRVPVDVTVDVCTSLSTFDDDELVAYPNPSIGMVNLRVPSDFEVSAIEVTDINGNTLLASGEYISQIDLQGFPAGSYYLKVAGNKGLKVFKLIIQ